MHVAHGCSSYVEEAFGWHLNLAGQRHASTRYYLYTVLCDGPADGSVTFGCLLEHVYVTC